MMLKLTKQAFLPLSILCVATFSSVNTVVHAGAGVGADIYCVMREGGNNHEASWRAAYQSIKVQKQGLFKTSPRQAATMIVEAVVRNPSKFKDCITYLGDLYPDSNNDNQKPYSPNTENTKQSSNTKDRYSY